MKFNTKPTSTPTDTETTNHEGATAWRANDPRVHLWKLVTANLIENTTYESDTESMAAVRDAVDAVANLENGPEFVMQLAMFAREELYQRDIAQLLLVIAANDERFHGRLDPDDPHSPGLIRAYAPGIVQRADEPATCIAIHNTLFAPDPMPGEQYPDTTLPSPLKKALSDALGQFDAYQLAKYSQSRRQVSLVDVFNMVRPDPAAAEWFGGSREEQAERYERVVYGEKDDHPDVEPLPTPKTWEHVKSNAPDEWSDKETWAWVLPDMGLFATIRNLRNMRQAGLSGDEIFGNGSADLRFTNENPPTIEDVRRSKVYPFRFWQAWTALRGPRGRRGRRARLLEQSNATDLLDAGTRAWLTDAMAASVESLPEVFHDTDTLVAVDASGSMDHALSENSTLTQKELAAFLGAVLSQIGGNVTVGVFGDDYREVGIQFGPDADDIPAITDHILKVGNEVGNSTNGWKALDAAAGTLTPTRPGRGGTPEAFDRVVIVTDCEIWDSSGGLFGDNRTVKDAYEEYADRLAERGHERPPLYMLDVASYPDFAIPSGHDNVFHISGWSERVLDFISYAERADPVAMVRAMEPRGVAVRASGGDE